MRDTAAMALRARFAQAGGRANDAASRDLLDLLEEQSPYLLELCIREPSILELVAHDGYRNREKPREVMAAELAACMQKDPPLERALRWYRNREYVRLGAREFSGETTFVEVGRELAHLADVLFDGALRGLTTVGDRGRGSRLSVIAMGKYGGEDLNFSSDVDVIYLYESDDAPMRDGKGPHDYSTDLARQLTQAIAEPNELGFCFRVDLRLRPEGTRGPLVNSLQALEAYYEGFGRPWERQAWIKARAGAGDQAVGAKALSLLTPFVYPRTTGPHVVDEVRNMLGRAQAERHTGDDVKLGAGGIREIEFFVQALQLLHGGKDPAIRDANTLRALDRLLLAGLVNVRERDALSAAYIFLRRLENRLQLEHGVQTHEVPADPERRAMLARRLGFADVHALDETLAGHRRLVGAIWKTLGIEDDARPIVGFATIQFWDGEAAQLSIEQLRNHPQSPFAPSAPESWAPVATMLLQEIAHSPDPDAALSHLTDLVLRGSASAGLWRLLGENRALAKLLVTLFGTSDFLARRFIASPQLIDQLLLAGRSAPQRPFAESVAMFRDCVERGASEEERLRQLRRTKQEEELRVGMHDIAGSLSTEQAGAELAHIAEAVVVAAFEMINRDGRVPMAVIALGGLGAGDISYGSDLDLIFVHQNNSADEFERAVGLAQRLIHALDVYLEEGRLYSTDTRIRPSGKQGTLVTSLEGFRSYHQTGAQVWERQALIRARVVAASPGLAEHFDSLRHEIAYQPPLMDNDRAEIRRLRHRMEHEIAGETEELYDLKLGFGGHADISFIIEALQLEHGRAHPELQTQKTLRALRALAAHGILPAPKADLLEQSYLFLRNVESRIRIVHDRSTSQVFLQRRGELQKLAQRLGYRGSAMQAAASLLEELRATRQRVRGEFDRAFVA